MVGIAGFGSFRGPVLSADQKQKNELTLNEPVLDAGNAVTSQRVVRQANEATENSEIFGAMENPCKYFDGIDTGKTALENLMLVKLLQVLRLLHSQRLA